MRPGDRRIKNRKANAAKMKADRKLIEPPKDVAKMLVDKYEAKETVKFDEDTGEPYRAFTIKL